MCWETAYEQWLNAPALSQQEQEELRAIQKDKMELRERFCAPLAFGTAGLRGTMKVGLHHMNVHVVRWVTQGFAEVICAESDWAGTERPRYAWMGVRTAGVLPKRPQRYWLPMA